MITKRAGETGEQFQARKATGIEDREIPAGAIVHLHGLPVRTLGPVVVETHQGNWSQIDQAEAVLAAGRK